MEESKDPKSEQTAREETGQQPGTQSDRSPEPPEWMKRSAAQSRSSSDDVPSRKTVISVPSMDHGTVERRKEPAEDAAEGQKSAAAADSGGHGAGAGRGRDAGAGRGRLTDTAAKKFRGLDSVQKVMVIGLLILAAILLFAVYKNNQVYTSYEVENQISRGDDTSVYYQIVKDGMIRYSNNGIAMTNKSGIEVWDQTFEMSSPIIAVSDSYTAIGDRGANSIYIFNDLGQCGKMTTDVPLQDIRISDQGVVAAVLTDTDGNYINLYDKSGNVLVSVKATLENTGYPETIALSPDGTHLVATYLKVSGGSVQSDLVFYDFSDTAGDKEIYSETVDGLCPKADFMNESRVVVFNEKGCSLYSVDAAVKKAQDIKFDDSIRSVFQNSQEIGFIFKNSDDKGKYRIELYDLSGKKNTDIYFDMDYSQISCDDDDIVVYNSSQVLAYRYNGRQTFDGKFEGRITSAMPSWEAGMYWIADDSYLSEIRIK